MTGNEANPFIFACGCTWQGEVSVDAGRIVCAEHGVELEPFERIRLGRIEVELSFVLETADVDAGEEFAESLAQAILAHPGVRTVAQIVTVEQVFGETKETEG